MRMRKVKGSANDMAEMGFLDHLEELRWRLLKALFSIIIFTFITFMVSDIFIQFLLRPAHLLQPDMKIQVLKVQGMLMLKFSIALVMGIVFSIPVIAYQFWAFVAPGLYPSEKRWGPWLVISVTIFFLVGVTFAYFVLIPFAIKFLVGIGTTEVEKNISIDYYAKFVLQLLVAAGVIFQMPVVSFILTKMGLVTPKFLRKSWRYAVIIILIFAAFITPPDPVSMIMMGIPLFLLYEFSILVSKIAMKKTESDSNSNASES
jgi:sec-independent protein translocase protein TatC